MPDVTVEEKIQAAPLSLYELVSNVTNMGRWSPETTACRWLGGATGPAPWSAHEHGTPNTLPAGGR